MGAWPIKGPCRLSPLVVLFWNEEETEWNHVTEVQLGSVCQNRDDDNAGVDGRGGLQHNWIYLYCFDTLHVQSDLHFVKSATKCH